MHAWLLALAFVVSMLSSCADGGDAGSDGAKTDVPAQPEAAVASHPGAAAANARGRNVDPYDALLSRMSEDLLDERPVVIHVVVVLCDNLCVACGRGGLGDGDEPRTNLYWGARFGLKTMFRADSSGWREIHQEASPDSGGVAEARIFEKTFPAAGPWRQRGVAGPVRVLLVAEAYKGSAHVGALRNYFRWLSGTGTREFVLSSGETVRGGGAAHAVGFIGHDYLMHAWVRLRVDGATRGTERPVGAFALACDSAEYFGPKLQGEGIVRLAMTCSFMAPEAYSLLGMLEALGAGESPGAIRERAAAAYARYQNISVGAARSVFCP